MQPSAEALVDRIATALRQHLPPGVTPDYFDAFLRRNRPRLVAVLDHQLAARAPAAPDLWSAAKRTAANPTRVAREVARVIQPLLPGLPREDGVVLALEPSAGIGRFVQAASGPDAAGAPARPRGLPVRPLRVRGRSPPDPETKKPAFRWEGGLCRWWGWLEAYRTFWLDPGPDWDEEKARQILSESAASPAPAAP